jgi:hypothetical protein
LQARRTGMLAGMEAKTLAHLVIGELWENAHHE